jgi:hypothetical protein
LVFQHLPRADRDLRGQRAEPLLSAQGPQHLDEGGDRGAFTPFQVLDRILGHVSPLGEPLLVDVLAQAAVAQMLPEFRLPFRRTRACPPDQLSLYDRKTATAYVFRSPPSTPGVEK